MRLVVQPPSLRLLPDTDERQRRRACPLPPAPALGDYTGPAGTVEDPAVLERTGDPLLLVGDRGWSVGPGGGPLPTLDRADIGVREDVRAGVLRQPEENTLEVALDHLIAPRTVGEALVANLRAVPPDRVAGRTDEAGGLDRGPDPEEVEELVDARRQRLGQGWSGRGSREEDHRASPRRKEPSGGCSGGPTPEDGDVDRIGQARDRTSGPRARPTRLFHPGRRGPPTGS